MDEREFIRQLAGTCDLEPAGQLICRSTAMKAAYVKAYPVHDADITVRMHDGANLVWGFIPGTTGMTEAQVIDWLRSFPDVDSMYVKFEDPRVRRLFAKADEWHAFYGTCNVGSVEHYKGHTITIGRNKAKGLTVIIAGRGLDTTFDIPWSKGKTAFWGIRYLHTSATVRT